MATPRNRVRPVAVAGFVLVALASCSTDSSTDAGSSAGTSGSSGTAADAAAFGDPDGLEPPVNPYLARSPWPTSHRSPYNQASSPLPGPTGADGLAAELLDATGVAITLGYAGPYDDGSYALWGSSFATIFKGVVDADTGAVRLVDEIDEPAELPFGSDLSAMIASAYTVADVDGTFFAARGRRIAAYGDAVAGEADSAIAQLGRIDLSDRFEGTDTLVALSMTWDGRLIAVSRTGVVLALTRDLEVVDELVLPGGEEISNSVAIDESGGIYVVTSAHVHRVQWTGGALSIDEADGAWTAAYESGSDTPAPGRLGTGSGTTPSLMGSGDDEDELLVIADGRDLMHVVAFWRDEIPEGWEPVAANGEPRIAGEVPITFGDPAATRSITEQSLTVRGYDTMAVSNTYGPPFDESAPNQLVVVRASGDPGVQPYGAELFRWDPESDTLTSRWANAEVSCPNGIPSMSAATGLAYCYGARDGSWVLEGIDWATGASAFSFVLGEGEPWNSAYAATEIGPGGSIASGTIGGMSLIVGASSVTGP